MVNVCWRRKVQSSTCIAVRGVCPNHEDVEMRLLELVRMEVGDADDCFSR